MFVSLIKRMISPVIFCTIGIGSVRAAASVGNAVDTLLVGRWTGTIDSQRVHDVLDGKIPYIESEVDDTVGLKNPTVVNPATERLQPTPQVDLDTYRSH